jgi:flagellar biosynthesis protein FlhF
MARHTFQVENIQAGLEQIKQELGPSAIIVKTRRVTGDDGKTLLEITAESNDQEGKDIPAADAAPSSAQNSTLRSITQLQKTILGLTEQIQRVQSEMRHLRMEVQTSQQTMLREETSVVFDDDGAKDQQPAAAAPLQLSPAFFESMHAQELRSLRLALTQLRDQSGDRQLFETLVEIHAALVAQDVLPIHADMFCARLLGSNRLGGELFQSARDMLTATLVTGVPPWEAPRKDAPQVQLFLGPAGCGKTSMVAKIAAHAAIKAGRHVALLSADAFRIGSHDQLETYAELIGIPFASADGLPLLERAVEVMTTQHPDIDLVLVDATSYRPFDESGAEDVLDIQTLMTLSESSLDLSTYVVLPATWSTRALLEYLEASRIIKPSGVIWTMLDVARRFGALYSVTRDVSIPTVLCSTGRAVPGDISTPDTLGIAQAILMNKNTL